MKKITLLLLSAVPILGIAQTKSTGVVNLLPGMTAELKLNNDTSTATLTLTGPSDRWFGLAFKNDFPVVGGEPSGMGAGNDLVYYNGTTLVDAMHNGTGETPTTDAVNNWTSTITSASGTTTIVATRAFNTGDSGDYNFNFALTQLDFAAARRSSASFNLGSHAGNRDVFPNIPLALLGVEDISLNTSTVFPNPSNGNFTVKAKTNLEKINVYSQTGAFIKTIEANNAQEVELKLSGIAAGVYLIELQNATEKSWKKILIK